MKSISKMMKLKWAFRASEEVHFHISNYKRDKTTTAEKDNFAEFSSYECSKNIFRLSRRSNVRRLWKATTRVY